jgi:two-component system chemotaxis sensor kinase CheA
MAIDPKLYGQLLNTFELELKEQHELMVSALIGLEKIKSGSELEEPLADLFRISHNLKGASKSVSNDKIASISHQLEDLFSNWRQEKHIPNKKEIDECLIEADSMLAAHSEFINKFKKKEENEHLSLSSEEGLKIPASKIEKANSKTNEFVNYQLQLEKWIKILSSTVKELSSYNEQKKSKTIKLISKQLEEIKHGGLQLIGSYSRSLQGLQDVLQSMRLVPISHLLIPLSRMVRDLSQSLNKSVQLKIKGGDIKIDKGILDLVKDPLNHLVRNAVDHAIEDDEERKKLNKSIPATININVVHASGRVIIEFKDDGKGIDLSKLKNAAIRSGIYTRTAINAMSDKEVLNLIYHSGLSTQQQVSEISGRGVGLDAVKENIEQMNGEINVESKSQEGTTFTLSLPLSLATTRGLIVKQNNHSYMLPTLSLSRLYSIEINKLVRVNDEHTYLINNEPVPVKSLGAIINCQINPLELEKKYPAIFIEDSKKKLLLLTEEITNEHDCVVYPLPPPLNKLKQFIGVTNMGEDELILVIDTNILLEKATTEGSLQVGENSIQNVKEKESKRVLIVDDSITTRTLALNSLKSVGFETETAVNGEQAWEIIQKKHFDCIVTDINMPKMDGFQLTRNIKKSEKHQTIPIVMVTSRDSDTDKEKGLDLGASAYLVKKQFDTHTLIKLIRTLV